MRLIDEQYIHSPFFGSRYLVAWLHEQGDEVERGRVTRRMEKMGIGRWFQFYHHERPHQGLRYLAPAGVYLG